MALEYLFAMGSGLVLRCLDRTLGPVRVCQIAVCLAAAGLAVGAGAMPLVVFAAGPDRIRLWSGQPGELAHSCRAAPPRMMSLIFSIKQTGVPLGGALAGALVPPLVLYLSWRWSAVAVALLCLAVALAIQPARAADAAVRSGVADRISGDLFAPLGMVLRQSVGTGDGDRVDGLRRAQLALIAYYVSYLNLELGYGLVAAGP